jgi:hypothetical protein
MFHRLSLRRAAGTLAALAAAVAFAPAAAHAAGPTQQCDFTRTPKKCWDDGGAPIVRSKSEHLGASKYLTTTPTLARNGLLTIDSYAVNKNLAYALHPRTMVVVYDVNGNAIWVSKIFSGSKVCAVLDFSCTSSRRETFMEALPDAVGKHAVDLKIYHGDGAYYVNVRNTLIDFIKATGSVAQEVKDQWEKLTKS